MRVGKRLRGRLGTLALAALTLLLFRLACAWALRPGAAAEECTA